MDKATELAFQLITLAGDAKSMAFEALADARKKILFRLRIKSSSVMRK